MKSWYYIKPSMGVYSSLRGVSAAYEYSAQSPSSRSMVNGAENSISGKYLLSKMAAYFACGHGHLECLGRIQWRDGRSAAIYKRKSKCAHYLKHRRNALFCICIKIIEKHNKRALRYAAEEITSALPFPWYMHAEISLVRSNQVIIKPVP